MTTIRTATPAELADWDERTVDVPGGHVLQSRAWAEHRSRTGWVADKLLFDDGYAVLALRRPLPAVGGWSAYVPRGPIGAGQAPDRTAERLGALADHFAEQSVAVLALRPERKRC